MKQADTLESNEVRNKGSTPTMESSAALARAITWDGSKQTYYTTRLMVDSGLVDDCFRAYAYFRWADDIVDAPSQSSDDRISFIRRQSDLIDRLYRSERPDDLAPEEEMIADLISRDEEPNSGLQSFIRNFLAIIEFDAYRKGRLISRQELTWYSNRVGKGVTDCMQHFIGNGHPYPDSDSRYLAAIGAHIAHMLRDMVLDTADGYINIPGEYLDAHGISPQDVESAPFRAWVRGQVAQARQYFREGKPYLDELDVLRCKIVGYWYCARFEGVLDTIERDGHVLRSEYNERRKLSTWLRMACLAVSVTFRHVFGRTVR